MDVGSTAEKMESLELSEEDTEELWNSPSKRGNKTLKKIPREGRTSPEQKPPRDGDSIYDRDEAREAALRNELQSVRKINGVIGGLLTSLDSAKGNMETVSRTVDSASTLLNSWTRILSQTEHNQQLILNPNWQGATQDVADIENEAAERQQAAERREQELQQQREAATRRAEEDERKRAQGTRTTRGTTRGRVRSGLGRTPSTSHPSTSSSAARTGARGSTTTTKRPSSGIGRGTGINRGRGRP